MYIEERVAPPLLRTEKWPKRKREREREKERSRYNSLEINELIYNSVVVSTGLCSPRYVNPRWE